MRTQASHQGKSLNWQSLSKMRKSLICSKCGRDLNEIWQDNMSPAPGLVLCEDCSGFTARSKFERQCWAEYERYLSQEFEAYIKEATDGQAE